MARTKYKKSDGSWEYADEAGIGVNIPSTEISANTAARHTHSNKTVLDGITAEKVAAWDACVADYTAARGVI